MKHKIMIVTKEYWPTTNGTVTCISNIIDELSKKHEVYVICCDRNSLRNHLVVKGNIKILYQANLFHIYFKIVDRIFKENGTSQLNMFGSFVLRALYYSLGKFTFDNEKAWTNVLYQLERDIPKLDVNTILSIAMPYSNVEIVSLLKKRIPRLISAHILFDLYKDNPVYLEQDKVKNTYLLREEKEANWIQSVDFIFSTSQMIESLRISYPSQYQKFSEIELPMIYDLHSTEIIMDSTFLNFTYTGLFYSNIRQFSSFTKFASQISKMQKNTRFHIFGVEKTEINYDLDQDNIVFYGKVDKKTALNAIVSADVLINISNKSRTQIPSKLYEYISSGRIIINIYSIENDLCNSILEKYRLAYSIHESQLDNQSVIFDILNFINDNKDEKISFNEISEIFKNNTPQHVADLIERKIFK